MPWRIRLGDLVGLASEAGGRQRTIRSGTEMVSCAGRGGAGLDCAPLPADPAAERNRPPRMSWLSKLMPSGIRTESASNRKRSVPEGLWEKCDRCSAALYRPELEENLEVCPKCAFHMPIRARARLASLFDPGPTTELAARLA